MKDCQLLHATQSTDLLYSYLYTNIHKLIVHLFSLLAVCK